MFTVRLPRIKIPLPVFGKVFPHSTTYPQDSLQGKYYRVPKGGEGKVKKRGGNMKVPTVRGNKTIGCCKDKHIIKRDMKQLFLENSFFDYF